MDGRGPISVEPNPHTGNPRPRCDTCDKVAYATEELAQTAADTILKLNDVQMNVYLGPDCGWYHLSRAER